MTTKKYEPIKISLYTPEELQKRVEDLKAKLAEKKKKSNK